MEVSVDAAPAELPQARVEALVAATVATTNTELNQVSVAFVSPERIQELNRTHRGKDKPTDVLSFPFDDDFPHGRGGEVVVCPEVAAATPITGGSLADELSWLVVHGALHLAGYEDGTEAGAAEMDRLTAGIISNMEQTRG